MSKKVLATSLRFLATCILISAHYPQASTWMAIAERHTCVICVPISSRLPFPCPTTSKWNARDVGRERPVDAARRLSPLRFFSELIGRGRANGSVAITLVWPLFDRNAFSLFGFDSLKKAKTKKWIIFIWYCLRNLPIFDFLVLFCDHEDDYLKQ